MVLILGSPEAVPGTNLRYCTHFYAVLKSFSVQNLFQFTKNKVFFCVLVSAVHFAPYLAGLNNMMVI